MPNAARNPLSAHSNVTQAHYTAIAPDTVTIWHTWTSSTDGTGRYANTTSDGTTSLWNHWIDQQTLTSVTTPDETWHTWVTSSGFNVYQTIDDADGHRTVYINAPIKPQTIPYKVPTAEEKAEADKRRREAEAAAEKRRIEMEKERKEAAKKAAAAKARSKELLLEFLTKEQREQFKKNGWFIVEGGKSKKKYRIESDGINGNVKELCYKEERVMASLCFQTRDYTIPIFDNLLGQALHLRFNEDEILKIANRTVIHDHRRAA
jgi:hypothetical protein